MVVDHGARLSVRELGQQRPWRYFEFGQTGYVPIGFHNYFQELDVDKHLKIVERHVSLATRMGPPLCQKLGTTSGLAGCDARTL